MVLSAHLSRVAVGESPSFQKDCPGATALARLLLKSARTSVRIGPIRIDRVPAVSHPQPLFPGEAGLLGAPLLGRFTVTFDIPHHRIVIE